MFLGELLRPNLALPGPVTQLSLELLREKGLKGLVLDVDDTLVPFHHRRIAPECHHWVQEIRRLGPVWLVSNNLQFERVRQIALALDLPHVAGAGKPSRRKLRQVLNQMDLPPQRVGMIGDRLLTDILVGNRLGMYTILVEPLGAGPWQPLRAVENWLAHL
ncbi:MAG: YqeG family HAD IIIA-type phosphatase [Gloeomargaritaceae cyanobacterium C42_A2020_066]|nr:YqeG family HAD IIIA-type phosphatase [Gloeomargaritaceae cyanobacterium C42_A2020_066]